MYSIFAAVHHFRLSLEQQSVRPRRFQMKKAFTRRAYLKLSAIAAAAVMFAAVQSSVSPEYQKVSASASGPSASYTGAPGEANCTACHTSFPVNSGTGGITITGLPANYKAGQQIPL